MADRGSMPRARREVKLGYLHVGAVEHGICRYGRLLAAEARRQPNVRVLERSIVLTDRPARGARIVRDAAEALSAADLIHIQISTTGDATWGRDLRAVVNLSLFRRFSGKPLAATLHDATTVSALGIDGMGPLARRMAVETLKGPMRPMVRLVRQVAAQRSDLGRLWRPIWDFRHVSPYVVARWAARRAHGLFVLTRKERDALTPLRSDGRLVLIPHFVEQAPAPVSPAIRAGRTRTVALAGFIFASKGHDLLIDAMPFMPDVKVVFVGGAGFGRSGPWQYRALLEQAQRRGVRGQADLAVCPFEDNKAASGSLSSLIALGLPDPGPGHAPHRRVQRALGGRDRHLLAVHPGGAGRAYPRTARHAARAADPGTRRAAGAAIHRPHRRPAHRDLPPAAGRALGSGRVAERRPPDGARLTGARM